MSGADARSEIDTQTGLNRFGCTSWPRPEALSFGSSTASSISTRAFCHAEAERCRFLGQPPRGDLFEESTERLRSELKRLLELSESEVEIVFSPSGTDSALHGLFLARVLSGIAPTDSILVASDETGSGVNHALSGQHFSTVTAEGIAVVKGEPIAGLSEGVTLISLPIRDAFGVVRPLADLDQEVIETVSRSVAAGHSVLLQVMDSSKFGVRCPSSDCLKILQRRFAGSVTIVVDACQMRISRARLKWHLAQGHMVLISGSKFFTGPPFSGALLVPTSLSRSIKQSRHIPPGLQHYTGRSAWPKAWTHIRALLPDSPNIGQYFRWAAALAEMHAYFSIPLDFRRAVLDNFAGIATELSYNHYPDLLLMEEAKAPSDGIDDAEMAIRTIFPFSLRQGKGWRTFEEATRLYRALNRNITDSLPMGLSPHQRSLASTLCHIGQPVRVPAGDSGDAGVIRICAAARMVSEVWSRYQSDPQAIHLQQERNDLTRILEKIELLSRYASYLK